MAITKINNPLRFAPVYNPIEFDLQESTSWTYVTYYTLVWNDDKTLLDQKQFRKSNVNNNSYFKLNFENTLQDYLVTDSPISINTKLQYTGKGWCKYYYGAVIVGASPAELLDDHWVFNGTFDRNRWIDLDITEIIPNGSTSSNGRFLTEFNDRVVKHSSIGTSEVFNGSIESTTTYNNNTQYLYTDYHNITYRNNNSGGYFNNKLVSVYDNAYGIRTLRLYVFPGSAASPNFVGGDIITYTMDPLSQAATYYGTTLNGGWVINRVAKFINGAVALYYVEIQLEDTIPTTSTITGGLFTSLVDDGDSNLVKREWSVFNRYFESGRYDPVCFKEDVATPNMAQYPHNKKLTFPSFPDTVRKSNGKRYDGTESVNVGATAYAGVYINANEDTSKYEIGDQIINFCDSPNSDPQSIRFNGKFTILDITNNVGPSSDRTLIVFDCLFTYLNDYNSGGIIWNIKKDSLLKNTKRIIPATMYNDSGNFGFEFKGRNILGMPDKFVVTLESGGPTYSIPKNMIIESVNFSSVITKDSDITMKSRTVINSLPNLTAGEKTAIGSASYSVSLCIHHQICDNAGYAPILGYSGVNEDPYYNNPVNESLDSYEIDLEKIVDCDTIESVTPNNKLSFTMKELCTKFNDVHITWLNNYGAYDSATFDLAKRQSREYQRNSYRKTPGKWSGNSYVYSKSDKELTDYIITTDKIGTINSDWVSEKEYNRLLEILQTPIVYMWVDDYYLPITIEMESVDEKTTVNDKRFNLTLNYRITYNQKSIRI